jgi:kinesin family protein 23
MRPRRQKVTECPEAQMEPVEVFARIKCAPSILESCIRTIDDKIIECIPPPSIRSDKGLKAGFTKVFSENDDQSQLFKEVARPMVSNLLSGKPGLLFNYGVTSSGKTYTMTGSPTQPGFLPRSLEMIFASIHGRQTEQFQVKSDDANGFMLVDDATYMTDRVDRRHEISKMKIENAQSYDIDEHYHEELRDGLKYAVFMSYVDIYNEQVYDLLEDLGRHQKPSPKRIRDHRTKGVYADGIKIQEIR